MRFTLNENAVCFYINSLYTKQGVAKTYAEHTEKCDDEGLKKGDGGGK